MIIAFEHHLRFNRHGYPSVRTDGTQHLVSRLASVVDVLRRHDRAPRLQDGNPEAERLTVQDPRAGQTLLAHRPRSAPFPTRP